MLILPTLADRVWFAYHCLPPDDDGRLPSWRELEAKFDLPQGTFSRTISGDRTEHHWKTYELLAVALRIQENWLKHGGDNGPVPNGGRAIPPRNTKVWPRHGDLPGWKEAVEAARAENKVEPQAAFFAGADMPVIRPVDVATAELAIAASVYAWIISMPTERDRYEELDVKETERRARVVSKRRTSSTK